MGVCVCVLLLLLLLLLLEHTATQSYVTCYADSLFVAEKDLVIL